MLSMNFSRVQSVLIGEFRTEKRRWLAGMRNCNNWTQNKLFTPFAISQQQRADCGY